MWSAVVFKCRWCGAEFEEPDRFREYHGERDRAPEIWSCCPECGSTDFDEADEVEEESEEEE